MTNDKQVQVNYEWFEKHLRPDAEQVMPRAGDEFMMCSPLRLDSKPSFSINLDKGCWNDFGTGEHGTLSDLADRLGVPAPGRAGNGRGRPRKGEGAESPAKREAAREQFRAMYTEAPAAPDDFPYWVNKRLALTYEENGMPKTLTPGKFGLKLCDSGRYSGWLIVPARDVNGKILSAQYISKEGRKEDHPGLSIGGLMWRAGTAPESAPMVLCEGMATAVTVKFLRRDYDVYCVFGAKNMPDVATALHKARPENELIIAADCDGAGWKAYNTIRNGEPGRTRYDPPRREGIPAALAAIPPSPKYKQKTDWNDVAALKGIDAAKEEFNNRVECARLLQSIQASSPNQKEMPRRQSTEGTTIKQTRKKDLKPIDWLVPGLIPRGGLTTIVAPAKTGKTWFTLQMAKDLSSGNTFLGRGSAHAPVPVLYFALQDREIGVKERFDSPMFKDFDENAPLYFYYGAPLDPREPGIPRMNQGGLEFLLDCILEKKPGAVFIDMWTNFDPMTNYPGMNAYQIACLNFEPLLNLGYRTNTTIILSHHPFKGAGKNANAAEAGSGSNGMGGTADNILYLYRDEHERTGRLSHIGRYEGVTTLDLIFEEGNGGGWRLPTISEAAESQKDETSENEKIIVGTMQKFPSMLWEYKALADETGIKLNSVKTVMRRLNEKGMVKRLGQPGKASFCLNSVEPQGEKQSPAGKDLNQEREDYSPEGEEEKNNTSNFFRESGRSLRSGRSPKSVNRFVDLQAIQEQIGFKSPRETSNCKASGHEKAQNDLPIYGIEGAVAKKSEKFCNVRNTDVSENLPGDSVSESILSLAARSGMTIEEVRAVANGDILKKENADLLPRLSLCGDVLTVAAMPDESANPAYVGLRIGPDGIEEECDV